MTRPHLAFMATAAALTLAACQYMPWSGAGTTESKAPPESALPVTVSTGEPAAMPDSGACAVLDSRGWEAWINKMPGPDMQPKIHVVGQVNVRTGGYTYEWQEGPLDRSAHPALRLTLVPIAPEGMALQAITTMEVKYEAPALATGYSRVLISCGGAPLAEITQITDVF
jgi:hypothetical protein